VKFRKGGEVLTFSKQRGVLQDEADRKIIQWLSELNFWEKQDDTFERCQEGTGQWLLDDPLFQTWLNGETTVLWCPGNRMSRHSLLLMYSWCRQDIPCVIPGTFCQSY
jgi:hypothetical protein